MGKERKHGNREVKQTRQLKLGTGDAPALMSDEGLRPMAQPPGKEK